MTAQANFANRTLFHGDNLDFLRGLNSGTIDLIATDPPFKKGIDFHAKKGSRAAGASFKDRWVWEQDVNQEWVDKIKDDFPKVYEVIDAACTAYGDDMGAFLCFLGIRMLEMHRVLKDTGSIYVHIDHTAHAWVKCLMDAVFGHDNFRNEIVWQYENRLQRKGIPFAKLHDSILTYTKTSQFTSNPITDPNWQPSSTQQRRLNTGYEVRKGTLLLYDQEKHDEAVAKYPNLPVSIAKASQPPLGDVWSIPILNPMAKERTGYPTQKPLALYERIIAASSNPGDVVLDPFCGCATTPIAAERLGRQWLGMDLWDEAHKVVMERMEQYGLLPEGSGNHGVSVADRVHYTQVPLERTDDGQNAAPPMRQRKEVPNCGHSEDKMSRAALKELLLEQNGTACQGCGIELPERYLQLDHNVPRSEGGCNHSFNRTLLCGPCNNLKSDNYTLTGLQKELRRRGWMSV